MHHSVIVATAGYSYDESIMITASHLPYERNGCKFFAAEGGLEKADIKDVLGRAAQLAAEAGVPPDNEFMGTAYVMTMALGVPAGLISQVRCVALAMELFSSCMPSCPVDCLSRT